MTYAHRKVFDDIPKLSTADEKNIAVGTVRAALAKKNFIIQPEIDEDMQKIAGYN